MTCLEDLLDAAGTDRKEWDVEKHVVNRWEQANGQGEVTPLWQVKAWLTKKVLARLERAPIFEVPAPSRPREGRVRRALVLPDTQTGFAWSAGHRGLIPYHDRRALDVALQVAAGGSFDELIWLGDNLDFEELSTKFTRDPLAAQTTQPAIDEQSWWYARARQLAPSAAHKVFDGNHEQRMKRALQEKASWAVHLHRAGESRPVMSVPYLLRLDELGVEWLGEYGSEYWLWDKVRITHGDTHASGGGRTVSKVLASAAHSQVFGHVHHVEMAAKVVWGPTGSQLVSVASPGCLCRTDGTVPGTKAKPDWTQGVLVVEMDVETGDIVMHPVQITNGRTIYGGRLYEGVDRTAQIAAELGYPQMVAETDSLR